MKEDKEVKSTEEGQTEEPSLEEDMFSTIAVKKKENRMASLIERAIRGDGLHDSGYYDPDENDDFIDDSEVVCIFYSMLYYRYTRIE